jgi:hypothetical protein
MEKYIGIDVHSESCTIAVMNSAGRQLRQQVVDTQAKVLIEFLKGLAGDRYLCIEEGQLAEWLVETLEPYAKEIAVVQPKAHQGHKSVTAASNPSGLRRRSVAKLGHAESVHVRAA